MENIPKVKRKIRASTTVRQKAQAISNAPVKKRRIRSVASKASTPFRAAKRLAKIEVYLPLPNTKFWVFMNKRRYWIPRYFRESFKELKLVTWPNRKETTQLTLAVFTFAIIFGILVAVVDYGLDILFRNIILKKFN